MKLTRGLSSKAYVFVLCLFMLSKASRIEKDNRRSAIATPSEGPTKIDQRRARELSSCRILNSTRCINISFVNAYIKTVHITYSGTDPCLLGHVVGSCFIFRLLRTPADLAPSLSCHDTILIFIPYYRSILLFLRRFTLRFN